MISLGEPYPEIPEDDGLSDEEFSELQLDAQRLFEFLRNETNYDVDGPLEWVFGFEASFEFCEEHHVAQFMEAFDELVMDSEGNLFGELQEFEDGGQATYHFVIVFVGLIDESELESLHQRFSVLASSIDAEYLGVECGEVGELDELAVEGMIHWTEEVLAKTGNWRIQDLRSAAPTFRSHHIAELGERGLEVADGMPTADSRGHTQLRPKAEIVRRLMAAFATFSWVSAPSEVLSDFEIKQYVCDNDLEQWFSKQENDWIKLSRTVARENDTRAGWIVENLWSLAWLLGNAPTVSPTEHSVPDSIHVEIRDNFLCRLGRNFKELMAESEVPSVETVITLEDFFYCAYNGCRNSEDEMQIGFLQERRQALTWALSPGVAWDDTDLST